MLFIALLSSATISNACSWWPDGEYVRFSLFSSSLAEGDDASPLFYSAQLFNDYAVDAYSGPTENLNEWYDYFGGKFTHGDIDQLIYGFPVDRSVSGIDKNPLMNHFKGGRHSEAAEYIMFSKQLEYYLKVDYWDKKEMDIENIEKSALFAEEKRNSVKDIQIKMRYTYQLIVMNYYLLYPEKVAFYYDQIMQIPTESVIKEWSRFFWANTLEDNDQRLYELSRVFDNSKSKSKFIFQRFPSKKSNVKGVLSQCKNDKEKATVMSLLAFKNPGRAMNQIKEIAELDATDELMDILLIREINKMEDWYYTDRYTSYGTAINTWGENEKFEFIKEKNFQSDKKYLMEFKTLAENIVQEKNIHNRELWYTSIAYMAYMLDDKAETEKFLHLAQSHAKTEEIKGQIAVIDLLHLVKHEAEWDEKFQKQLMIGVERVDEYDKELYRFERFQAQLMLAISRKYLEEDKIVLAALFESKVDGTHIYELYSSWSKNQAGYQAFDLLNENASSEDLDELFKLWEDPNKTPLEKWLFQDMEKFKWRITELWGTQYFREDNLERALEVYETIPDSIWHVDNSELHYYYGQELRNDPFESSLWGRTYEPNWGKTYTKPEFIREILRLKGMLEGPVKDKAQYALLLGNAYYNMTYNGNSYYYTEYSWGSTWGGRPDHEYPREHDYYYTSERALVYYEMAENLAPNPAFGAFCYRMQLKCKQDAMHHTTEDYKSWDKKTESEWKLFGSKYPEHFEKLKNCDRFDFYSNAWKQG